MADDPPIVNPDPPISTIAAHRIPEPITEGERETFEAKIEELEEKIETLESKIVELTAPPTITITKGKSFLDRFSPL